jgi:hypothetical protein
MSARALDRTRRAAGKGRRPVDAVWRSNARVLDRWTAHHCHIGAYVTPVEAKGHGGHCVVGRRASKDIPHQRCARSDGVVRRDDAGASHGWLSEERQ